MTGEMGRADRQTAGLTHHNGSDECNEGKDKETRQLEVGGRPIRSNTGATHYPVSVIGSVG